VRGPESRSTLLSAGKFRMTGGWIAAGKLFAASRLLPHPNPLPRERGKSTHARVAIMNNRLNGKIVEPSGCFG
jgi:hypothetical protein